MPWRSRRLLRALNWFHVGLSVCETCDGIWVKGLTRINFQDLSGARNRKNGGDIRRYIAHFFCL